MGPEEVCIRRGSRSRRLGLLRARGGQMHLLLRLVTRWRCVLLPRYLRHSFSFGEVGAFSALALLVGCQEDINRMLENLFQQSLLRFCRL